MQAPDSPIYRYHDGTKHHFHRFARSIGYLDWASQPRPFRSFAGSPSYPLYPSPEAHGTDYAPVAVDYDRLFQGTQTVTPLSFEAIGDFLRHSLGLSAWKAYGSTRWSLRVNPSSGNLHPTEAYVICGPLTGLAQTAGVYHYAPETHVLEQRCSINGSDWITSGATKHTALLALTSIHWRESWKYGERAFRYCQHDLGHAIAALTISARMLGWDIRLLAEWSHEQIAGLTGVDRDEDYVDVEREEPGCVLQLTAGSPFTAIDPASLVAGARSGRWSGRPSQLSEDHVQWTFIDDIAEATRDPGHVVGDVADVPAVSIDRPRRPSASLDARALVLRRRSAVAFDGLSTMEAETFFGMLRRMAAAQPPLRSLWWTPRIHFVVFVHRVNGVSPGIYLFGREPAAFRRLQDEIGGHHARETAHDVLPFICLGQGDCRVLSRRLSCDQEIASDGCFSLGMLAEFDRSLTEYGPSFYRNLFWESGAVGQVLYLEAEAAGVRATGIGCFYDDPVHEMLGLRNHAFQSLYHFTVGTAVEDRRLTTETGYQWG